MIKVGDKVLLTLNNWFLAPDGKEYRAVFGTVSAVLSDQETLGIKTNARATNWYIVVGNVTIAGCQVYYAVKCDDVYRGEAETYAVHEGKMKLYNRPSMIYVAEVAG